MKTIFKLFAILFLVSPFFIISCEKAEPLTIFPDGTPSQLTVTSTGQTATFADSTVPVLNLSWTDPQHAQDKSLYKYVIEIDSSDRDFKNANIFNVNSGSGRTQQLLGYQIQQILIRYGYINPAQTYNLYFRVISSYGNNNEALKSSPVRFQVRPYQLPKVNTPVNNEIWLVGGASDGGWNNPLSDPFIVDQKFRKTSATQYELTTYLYANQGYLILPVMGSWSTKYCLPDGINRNTTRNGGDFTFKTDGGQDFLSPADEGTYKITLDYMTGKFIVAQNP
jgi:hypothetical protein